MGELYVHPRPEQLEADTLPDWVAAHLQGCPDCRVDRMLLRGQDPPAHTAETFPRDLMARAREEGSRSVVASWATSRADGTMDDDARVDLLPQGAVAGAYSVEGLLGHGGMAAVYLVRHRELGTRHAMKVLTTTGRTTARRLVREGRLQGSLRHPNVVGVTDSVDVGGQPALVLELVDGPTLDRLLRAGPLPLDVIDAIALDVCAGLGAAHAVGLVHRDVKPGNVLLCRDGGGVLAKIGDFGLAKARLAALADSVQTRTGAMFGTPAYMAPEQLRDASRVDARTDVFALGALLYELVTGHRCFEGTGVLALMTRVAAGEHEPVRTWAPHAPQRMVDAIEAALRVDPAQRPADASAVRALWLGGLTERALRASRWPEHVLDALDDLRVVRALPSSAGPSHTPGRATVRVVPAERDPFVGRTDELAELRAMVERGARLVTVHGLGGVGKSRLAQRFALDVGGDWDGVYFCDASTAASQDDLARVVAEPLGLQLPGPDPIDSVGAALAGRGRCLVVLDGFEQLLGDARATVGRWVDRAPDAVFLVTSRVVLGVPGQQQFPLDALGPADAIELFAQRARAARPDFSAAGDEDVLQRLVEALDRLPLAIELAAARVRVMSLSTIHKRLEERFRLLDGGARSGTLRAAIGASFALLGEHEQAVFARLATFRGPFSMEDAEAVAAVDDPDAPWVVDVVESLLDKSLLRRAAALRHRDGEPSFVMYGAIRDFARERLRAAPPVDRVAAERAAVLRHAAWYARLGERRAVDALTGPDGVATWRARRRDLDNLQEAVVQALALGRADLAALAWCGLASVLERSGPHGEAMELGERVLATGSVPLEVGLRARMFLADLCLARGEMERGEALLVGLDPDLEHDRALLDTARAALAYRRAARTEARERLGRAIPILERVGTPRELGVALRILGNVQAEELDLETSIATEQRALDAFQRAGDQRSAAHIRVNLAADYAEAGRYADAERELEAALVVLEEVGDERYRVSALANFGNFDMHRGDLRAAVDAFANARRVAQRSGFRFEEAFAASNETHARFALGDFEGAVAVGRRGAELVRGRGADVLLEMILTNLSAALLSAGRLDEAAAVLEELSAFADMQGRFAAWIHQKRAILARRRGDLVTARAEAELGLVAVERSTLPASRARILAELVSELADLGERAQACLERLAPIDLADDSPTFDTTFPQAVVARILALAGRHGEARQVLDRLETRLAPLAWPESAPVRSEMARVRGLVG